MPVPEEAVDHLDYTFDEMHTYSDLEYTILQGQAGFVYSFRPGLTWMVEGAYYDLTDGAAGYVYGDESGSFFVVRSGVTLDL